MKITTEDVDSLIEVIEWYRDYYHKSHEVCNELIQNLTDDPDRYYSSIERYVDDWIDY